MDRVRAAAEEDFGWVWLGVQHRGRGRKGAAGGDSLVARVQAWKPWRRRPCQ